jgi:hypothetical protein
LVLHIAVGGFDAAVCDRALLRGLHGGQVRREGQTGCAVAQESPTNETTAVEATSVWRSKRLVIWEGTGHIVMLVAIPNCASEAERGRTGQRGQGAKLVERATLFQAGLFSLQID